MEILYANKKLEDDFTNMNELKKHLDYNIIKKWKIYNDSLEAADTFSVFLITSLDHPEALTGYSKLWSLRLSKNVRFLFELENEDPKLTKKIIVKGIADYHESKINWYIK